MNLKDYLKKHKLTHRGLAKKLRISPFSLLKYIYGQVPAKKQAWKIFNATDGEVTFHDLGYSEIPKNPLKDF